MDQPELPYQVKIEKFEGPLDLLLHLVRAGKMEAFGRLMGAAMKALKGKGDPAAVKATLTDLLR